MGCLVCRGVLLVLVNAVVCKLVASSKAHGRSHSSRACETYIWTQQKTARANSYSPQYGV
ncbi:hypothetical protein PF005_g1912 [Phytophthora fragariae]|uniref:Secreted protein n=1 Tax=Phytophthora fragariae TaxID=53985 RepID=A0A6A3FQL0_9STRA|nr:hypothetical protein PF003_g27237 [Phytophthora fragariae]KAE8948404.1 hypothetical protein PF009_g2010 [Phytophthora fragariae]KAE9027714.1 hypothetical protein PF011_g1909 [Phytophthora fragariae]KAE9132961.1 hypothetical protein PF010_g3002 [Phytophthora fragariae]KAE9136851.1 hypothetical protein PF007_g2029 [Phytophthora fragariae]